MTTRETSRSDARSATAAADSSGVIADAAARAAELWGDENLAMLASERVQGLTGGTFTDWGLAGSVRQPTVQPISLAGGVPDAKTQPREALMGAMQRALDTEDDLPLVYGGPVGYEPLREEMAKFFARDHRQPLTADHYVLANGAAGAIDLVVAALISPGDVIITETPTFTGSLRTFRGHEAEIVGVHLDDEGIRMDELVATVDRLERDGRTIKLIYTIPTFHNPTGITTTLQRRADLVQFAAEHRILILEDSAYSEIYFGEDIVPSMSAVAGGNGVIAAGTFSKVIATGLRVGWVQAHPDLLAMMVRTRFDMGNSPLLHRMLYQLMVTGELEEHIGRQRRLYADKMHLLSSTLREGGEPYFRFDDPEGGFFLWLEMRAGLSAQAVQAAAYEEGAVFPAGARFYVDHDAATDGEYIRLAYSWSSSDEIAEAAARLLRACARAAGD